MRTPSLETRTLSETISREKWDRFALSLAGAIIAAAVLIKFLSISRANINWDEFWYLTAIHRLSRGELASAFQSTYTWAFAWLPAFGNEITQITIARWIMTLLFGMTALLIWKLALRWTTPTAAAIAPIAYLSFSFVIVHGGSFRADSMLAPLSVGILAVLSADTVGRRRIIASAFLFAVALLVTIKTLLLLPTIIFFLRPHAQTTHSWMKQAILFFAIAAAAAVLFGIHATFVPEDATGLKTQLSEAAGTSILNAGFFPRARYLRSSISNDFLIWILVAMGFFHAVFSKRWNIASLSLFVAPVAFYRNSYPYYYVVMLAPTVVLASVACQELMKKLPQKWQVLVPLTIAVALCASAIKYYALILEPRQDNQRAVVSAVHAIFPDAVPYADHAGIIASFPKTNPFLSTWGVDSYLRKGKPFMDGRAIFVLADSPVLRPGTRRFSSLLNGDRLTIEREYIPLWGPISVAGADFSIETASTTIVRVPVPGYYRLEATASVLVNGTHLKPGESVHLMHRALIEGKKGVEGRLIWAAARRPLLDEPHNLFSLYDGFSL